MFSPDKLTVKVTGSEQNCHQRFFLENVYMAFSVKIHNFPHLPPLAFSPSVDLSPPLWFLACISLNIGTTTKMVVFKINLCQIFNIMTFEPSSYL